MWILSTAYNKYVKHYITLYSITVATPAALLYRNVIKIIEI